MSDSSVYAHRRPGMSFRGDPQEKILFWSVTHREDFWPPPPVRYTTPPSSKMGPPRVSLCPLEHSIQSYVLPHDLAVFFPLHYCPPSPPPTSYIFTSSQFPDHFLVLTVVSFHLGPIASYFKFWIFGVVCSSWLRTPHFRPFILTVLCRCLAAF